ncbi:MAG: VCBS repeat-containing protein [Saprospiraceae bacterium]|nr:VCBS repeat-containing protein [Saprospiraceae bacterium]
MRSLFWASILSFVYGLSPAQTVSSSAWTYLEIDTSKQKWGDWAEPTWLRYFGLDVADINGDRFLDIVSGRYVYFNPGGDMTDAWKRISFPENVDAILTLDVDGDQNADVIAQALPDIYWFEATDATGAEWKGIKIGEIPATSHVNSQGFEKGQIIAGGREEFVIAGDGDVYLFMIPQNPGTNNWEKHLVAENTSDEGIGLGDIDGDGDLDIVAGRRPEGGDEPLIVTIFENAGITSGPWTSKEIGTSNHPIDRVEIADLNGDQLADIVISEERYPGLEPDANLFWFQQVEGNDSKWTRHCIVTQFSMNNLDIGDVDDDGDMDIITNEHKGPILETQIWQNDGQGNFKKETIDRGKENHLGTQLADLDGDGDLDLVGAAWDNYRFMHVWRNDFHDQRFIWKHLSTTDGSLPATNGSNQQTASLVADVNQDGIGDIFITDRTTTPSVLGLFYTKNGWVRHIIDDQPLRIEAGSAAHDIDGDGDLDLVFGGESQSNEIWWWENPYPNFDPDRSWVRHFIKKSGKNKHHDQAFIDFDGDNKKEFVFWNQSASTLFYAEVPADPRNTQEWNYKAIYQYGSDGEMQPRSTYPSWRRTHEHEGLYPYDMNDDGVDDIVAGGRWFEYHEGDFIEHIIDASYTFTRSAAGQLIEGGKPEVVLVVGDGLGPLVMYEWQEGNWVSTILIEQVDNGHTLDIVDFDGDGHLDIFNAEMRFGEGNPDSEVRIFLGDGKGNFSRHVVARGFGVHEGRIIDLDGDGDLDILGKPYTWQAPRLDIWINETPK